MKTNVVRPWQSILLYFLIAFTVLYIIHTQVVPRLTKPNLAITIGIALIYSAIFKSKAKIEIEHVGVPLFFGQRLSSFLFSEGEHFLLRPLLSLKIVDLRDRAYVSSNYVIFSKNEVGFKPKIILLFKVIDPYKFAGVNEGTLDHTLNSVVPQAMRDIVETRSIEDKDLLRMKGSSVDDLKHAVNAKIGSWGLIALEAIMKDVIPESSDVMNSYAMETIEARERRAETLQASTLRENVRDLMRALSIDAATAERMIARSKGQDVSSKEVILTTSSGKTPPAVIILPQ